MQIEKKHRLLGAAAAFGILLLVILLGFFMEKGGTSSGKPALENLSGAESVNGSVIYFMQTAEDADCILIKDGEDAVLIDTGEEQDAEHILEVLEEYGVTQLDLMILTHPDKDHIGGAAAIAQEITVSKAIEPYYTQENERNAALHAFLQQEKISVQTVEEVESYEFGDFSLTVFPPQEEEYKKDNNYSLAVLFSHGESYAFFTGDAVKKRQKELMELKLPEIDLLKVPYHGRYTEGEEELIEKLAPEYAVVTAKEAENEVEAALRQAGAEVWYTRRGDVAFGTVGEEFYLIQN